MIGPRLILLALTLLAVPAKAAEPDAPAVIGALIEAEFALQSGDLEAAAERYLFAAREAEDAELAARAASIALAGKDRGLAREAMARWRQLAPAEPMLLAQSLSLALRDGEHESAMDLARALLQLPSDKGWPLLLRVLAEAEGDARIIARAVVAELPGESAMPDDIRPWLAFAGLARRWDDTLTAGRLVDHALARFPDESSARLLQASRLRERGDAAAARLALIAVLESPEALPPGLRRAAARELAASGDPLRAAELLGRGTQAPEDYALRASWLIGMDDVPALTAFRVELEALSDEGLPPRRLLLGHVCEALQQWSDAEQWYRSVAGEGADMASLRLAQVLLQQDRESDAIAALQKLQQAKDVDGERLREAFLFEADLHGRAGRDAEAMSAYARALSVLEGDHGLLYGRALHHERHDRVDEALADLRLILLDDADHAAALNAYGYTVLERRGDIDEAQPYIEKAHRLEPDSPAILDSLGWLYVQMKRLDEALPVLQRAWAEAKDPEIAAHLGEALWQLDRREEARAVWREGLAIDAEHPALRDVKGRLQP
ncbi:MAG TPA: tetratricopeptide repeat protein [Arenimonas sp.]|nr:tetratricopeptide repeat protein [Arenimonas sp.]